MSTSNEQSNKDNANKSSRPAQSQRSTLLFGAVPQRDKGPLRDVNQDITAVSLSIDTPLYKIPTLTPQKGADTSSDAQTLKESQLHYLEANQSLTQKAIHDAQIASKILAETKATQQALLDKLKESNLQVNENNEQMQNIEQGIAQCERILRESNFIYDEIEKIHEKIQKQTTLLPSEEHLTEVNLFISKLQNSQKALENYQVQINESEQQAENALNKVQEELEACETLRNEINTKNNLVDEQLDSYQKQIDGIVKEAQDIIEVSKNSLEQSKNGQSSYLALSREINALREEFQKHKKNTSTLTHDLESANKAIALNKVAVEALTSDMNNIKLDIKTTAKSTVFTAKEQDENRKAMEKLLDDTKSAHKRMNQLLQLNNAVNDRLTKIDSTVASNANRQDVISREQQQALVDIQEQREACKRLIDQATRSHALIVAACKKTSQLAEQIDTTTKEEKEYKDIIINALKDLDDKKGEYTDLQDQILSAQNKQLQAIEELEKTHQSLKETEDENKRQLSIVEEKTSELDQLSPALKTLQTECTDAMARIKETLEEYTARSEELRQLQSAISKAHHIQVKTQDDLVKKMTTQLDEATESNQASKDQHTKMASLEESVNQHISRVEDLTQKMITQMNEVDHKLKANQDVAKDIEYSSTELRYIKEQCDQLLQDCMNQNQIIQKEEAFRQESIQTIKNMQQDLSQALSRQSQQEEEIEQLNTIARNALEDLNQKIDQFHGMQQQTMEQQSSIKQIQNAVNNAHQNQTELQLQVEKAVAAVRNHLEAVSKKEDNLLELERTITRQSDESAHIIADQQLQIDEQNEIIKAQAGLLDRVNETYDKTQQSLETIDQIRKKAQQSFAHLGAQKAKFEASFKEAIDKVAEYDDKQIKQDSLLDETKALTEKLVSAASKADEFSQWQESTKKLIDEKLNKIDEYQSRAYHAQQSAQAREKQLEQQNIEVQQKLNNLDQVLADLNKTRREEAQYRDEMRALLQQHEQQHREVQQKFMASQEQHQTLSRALDDAHLMFRENKLATKETQMANRETKFILQEIKRELSQTKQEVQPNSQFSKWESESRLDQLESQMGQSISRHEAESSYESFSQPKKDDDSDHQEFNPTNFML
ncbi:MAG TPA: hypothetical protein DHW71_05210 [Gammaproteobacteria bacterium]|nr:hypothetical protein [Gammaproteobacteria bacterium]HCK92361.1 hypothetical protein [Gammaproteobacteria bacterium]|tara:strand:- start:73857 stop:77204 length:3348 start_codon:yes stop_codon:yes gene_type:complete